VRRMILLTVNFVAACAASASVAAAFASDNPAPPPQPLTRAISAPPVNRAFVSPVKGDKVNHLSNLGRALPSAPRGFSEMIASESTPQARNRPLLIVIHLAETTREVPRGPQPGDKVNHLRGEPLREMPRRSELFEEARRDR
jgi:hypothetical protein